MKLFCRTLSFYKSVILISAFNFLLIKLNYNEEKKEERTGKSMAIEVFNRYEHKYLLNQAEYDAVREELERHMEPDAYNQGGKPYTITNLYYDTPDDYLIRTSLSKPVYKEKLRLRSYGVPQPEDAVFLEIKKKVRGLVNKRRSGILLSDAYRFAKTGILPPVTPEMNGQVMRELAYFLSVYRPVPKLYLAYDRVAYFERGNPDLRISFDQKIRARREELRLEAGDYGRLLLPEGQYLMEIKTAFAKPLWLTDLLTAHSLRRKNFSKYGTEFRQTVQAAV